MNIADLMEIPGFTLPLGFLHCESLPSISKPTPASLSALLPHLSLLFIVRAWQSVTAIPVAEDSRPVAMTEDEPQSQV